ncbi:hypothetical protein BCR33DRAFT_849093 [Rhizoclosmatium globosum]|uniref:Extracellular membrane protein CFEM domain-containing protein n=1 Tax=Rhizoclosmatium globosum TaxID=329046 RepID=A0A1Y2CHG0_9FUNG|nr:hypothetical protein BCR33DRAFT_849093 [Rhizoclosmatium globosum]|eukprot:ORY46347.1 hypothetical protein BCR33DRAFT_849093 [Rhizoclosmatium globosum]
MVVAMLLLVAAATSALPISPTSPFGSILSSLPSCAGDCVSADYGSALSFCTANARATSLDFSVWGDCFRANCGSGDAEAAIGLVTAKAADVVVKCDEIERGIFAVAAETSGVLTTLTNWAEVATESETVVDLPSVSASATTGTASARDQPQFTFTASPASVATSIAYVSLTQSSSSSGSSSDGSGLFPSKENSQYYPAVWTVALIASCSDVDAPCLPGLSCFTGLDVGSCLPAFPVSLPSLTQTIQIVPPIVTAPSKPSEPLVTSATSSVSATASTTAESDLASLLTQAPSCALSCLLNDSNALSHSDLISFCTSSLNQTQSSPLSTCLTSKCATSSESTESISFFTSHSSTILADCRLITSTSGAAAPIEPTQQSKDPHSSQTSDSSERIASTAIPGSNGGLSFPAKEHRKNLPRSKPEQVVNGLP